ncbi:12807_t:CDS:2 [Entrophospora sp. SA101]|nr:12807_t:CDS:2 [Entrophospora sp. SA101]
MVDLHPIHPGEILREELLKTYQITPQQLAQSIKVKDNIIEELVKEQRDITPELSYRLELARIQRQIKPYPRKETANKEARIVIGRIIKKERRKARLEKKRLKKELGKQKDLVLRINWGLEETGTQDSLGEETTKKVLNAFLEVAKQKLLQGESINFKGYFTIKRSTTKQKGSKHCGKHDKSLNDFKQANKGKGITVFAKSEKFKGIVNEMRKCRNCKNKKQQLDKKRFKIDILSPIVEYFLPSSLASEKYDFLHERPDILIDYFSGETNLDKYRVGIELSEFFGCGKIGKDGENGAKERFTIAKIEKSFEKEELVSKNKKKKENVFEITGKEKIDEDTDSISYEMNIKGIPTDNLLTDMEID